MICESQWKLARLLFADFDVSVGHIVAQPFLLKAEVAGAVRRRIPDYLLPIDVGPLAVETSPTARWNRPHCLVSYLVRTTPPGSVRVSTRFRFTQLSSEVKNGVPPPTRTG